MSEKVPHSNRRVDDSMPEETQKLVLELVGSALA